MESDEDLEKYTKQLNVEKEVLLNQIKSLSEELSAKKAIIVKCFQLFENYTNILIKVNTICKCNAINNQLSVICVNNERKCLFDNNCQEIDVLITDSENVIQKFETNNNEMNDKHLFSYYSKELKAKQTTNDGKPDLMSSDDSEDSNTCIESDLDPESDENVNKNFGSKSTERKFKYNKSEDFEVNDEINVNQNELKKLDLTENKGKDYVDEILQNQDLLKCQQKYNQINDKSEKPLIIGNFKKKSHEEKSVIRKKLLRNKYLIKKCDSKSISLSVPQICFDKSKPIRSEVLIGFECPYNGCEYRKLIKCLINYHIKDKHLKIKPFICEICSKSFALNFDLNKHKLSVHSNEQLKCDVKDCEFVTKYRTSLLTHKRYIHINNKCKPYACGWPECEAKFRDEWGLNKHINAVHKNIKQFYCDWPGCEAKFASNDGVIKHSRKHTGEKPYLCQWPGCGEYFRSSSDRSAHQHIHDGRKKHICHWPGCEAQFNDKCELTQHTRNHTGEKPYACDWPECGKSFIRQTTLRRHQLIHKGVKPYSCQWNGCEASFLNNHNLKRHVISHEKGGNMKRFKRNKTINK